MVARAVTPTHAHLRSRLIGLAIATILLDAVASVLIFFFERHESRTQITNIGDSIFWTTTQLLTVSSQFPNPERSLTKVVDVVLELWAIVIVTSLAATFTDVLHHRTRRRLHERGIRPPPT